MTPPPIEPPCVVTADPPPTADAVAVATSPPAPLSPPLVLPPEDYESTRPQRDAIRADMAADQASLADVFRVVYFDYQKLRADCMLRDSREAEDLKAVIASFEALYRACEEPGFGTLSERAEISLAALRHIQDQRNYAYSYVR